MLKTIAFYDIISYEWKFNQMTLKGGLPVKCALWLNRKQVRHASEISENPDIASLRGYFIAGSLMEWLNENGGEEYAAALAGIPADDERLNEKLAEVFGGEPLPAKALDGTGAESPPVQNAAGSFASFGFGSFNGWEWLRSLLMSGSFGSFSAGSFHEWEWEWLYRLFFGGSFTGGSFGSFSQWERFYKLFGSFGAFGSFGFGSFPFGFMNGIFGSFAPFDPVQLDGLDEYDRIMLETLMLCPLDRFGYGIHNI